MFIIANRLFRCGSIFTPEVIIAARVAEGWYDGPDRRDAALEKLRGVFASSEE